MQRIDINSAQSQDWDVVLVGTSFAAFFFAHALKGRGLKVLFVERGRVIAREEQLENRANVPYVTIPQTNHSQHEKDWTVLHQFGGCSNCWWGNTPRFHPNDFRLRTRYGVAHDWPISYEDVEPFYVQAERIMDVAGGGSDAFLPRSAPFPAPGHKLTRAERKLREHDPRWVAMPTARSNGGTRAKCCATGTCKLCPIDSKFTILNALSAFDGEPFSYVTGVECRSLYIEGGQAKGVVGRTSQGADVVFRAPVVGLGANAISNSAILLRSGLTSELIGVGLHEQASQFVWLDIPFDNYYGGTSTTGAGYVEYDGDFRAHSASVFIESWNAPPSLRLERGKWLQRLKVKLIAEDIPDPRNKVVLDGDEPRILWHGHRNYAYAGLKRALEKLPTHLPFENRITRIGRYEPTESHIQGGTAMGPDSKTGVVDRMCRLFDHQNVYCLGAGVFTSCSAANPTLTLSALSLRAGANL